MGKIQLKPVGVSNKKRAILKLNSLLKPKINLKKKLYYSGFAMTDNFKFIIFNISKQFILDNFIQDDIVNFIFNEEAVDMRIDRNVSLKPIVKDNHIEFENFGSIDKNIFNMIVSISPLCSFMPVTEWFGGSVNTLVCCISSIGKPVAVVKTI